MSALAELTTKELRDELRRREVTRCQRIKDYTIHEEMTASEAINSLEKHAIWRMQRADGWANFAQVRLGDVLFWLHGMPFSNKLGHAEIALCFQYDGDVDYRSKNAIECHASEFTIADLIRVNRETKK